MTANTIVKLMFLVTTQAVKKITMRSIYRLQHHFNHQKEWAVTLWYFMPVRLPYLLAVWVD